MEETFKSILKTEDNVILVHKDKLKYYDELIKNTHREEIEQQKANDELQIKN